jgi:hypothetical protein
MDMFLLIQKVTIYTHLTVESMLVSVRWLDCIVKYHCTFLKYEKYSYAGMVLNAPIQSDRTYLQIKRFYLNQHIIEIVMDLQSTSRMHNESHTVIYSVTNRLETLCIRFCYTHRLYIRMINVVYRSRISSNRGVCAILKSAEKKTKKV